MQCHKKITLEFRTEGQATNAELHYLLQSTDKLLAMWQETYYEMEFGENWEFTWWSHESCFIKHSNFQVLK